VAKFGVTSLPRQYNPQALGNVTPYYSWHIDSSKIRITGSEVMQALAETRPLAIGALGANAGGMRGRDPSPEQRKPGNHRGHTHDPSTFGFTVWQLKDGEDKIIADRLVEIFSRSRRA
jgi:L-seryl-tRNA(Ser) seleniumtransferase